MGIFFSPAFYKAIERHHSGRRQKCYF